jgi:hypothetical protein
MTLCAGCVPNSTFPRNRHGASNSARSAAVRQSQVDAAVRFCAKVFGQEYASLLAKAAEVASLDHERKVATRA